MIKSAAMPVRQFRNKNACTTNKLSNVFAVGDWTMRYYPLAKKCKLDSPWPVGAVFSGFPRGVGGWCSTASGFAGSYNPLPGFGVLVTI